MGLELTPDQLGVRPITYCPMSQSTWRVAS